MFIRFSLLSSIALLLLADQPLVQAEDAAPSVRVRIDDLNLASEVGRYNLAERLQGAAVMICSPGEGSRGLSAHVVLKECRTVARTSADGQIDRAVASAMEVAKIAMTLRKEP